MRIPFRNIRIKGFTLIEIMVALSIFSIVMLVAVGSLLSVLEANRKAQALKSVINNLNFALESMSRSARVGTSYHCRSNPLVIPSNIDKPRDCRSGGELLAFEAHDGDPGNVRDQVVYRLNGTRLERSVDGGRTFVALTAPEVVIEDFEFRVEGAAANDELQPTIVIHMRGTAGVSERVTTAFDIQTSLTQRILDLPD